MKNLFLLVLFAASLSVSAQQNFKMSLTEAIDYAQSNQPAFQNYKADRQIAASKKMESASKYVPKLNGSFDLRDNLKLGKVVLKFPNPITNVEEEKTIQQGTKYSANAGVDLNVPLLDMGAAMDIKYSKTQQQLSDLQYQQGLIDLKVNVTKAYYMALLNTERVAKAEKSVTRFQKAYDDTRVKFENQNALKTDMNRAFLNLSNAKFQLTVVQDSIKTSKNALAQLIGLPVDAALELSDKLPDEIKMEILPEYPDYKSAELNRVELRAEMTQQKLNKVQLQKINWQYLPSISGYGFIGGQGLDNEQVFKKENWFWTSYIGVRVNVPIFDGLQKLSLANQQKWVIKKNENNLSSIKNNINYQLQTAAINYSNAAANLALIKENVKLAEEVVKDVNVRYANSLSTYQEVLDSENTLKETEFNYLQQLYIFLLAEIEWKKANGKI